MSTRSSIAYLNKDGSVNSVYCHFDGYPQGVGFVLNRYHSNDDDAKKIIELGDMSYLAPKLEPTTPTHSFDTPEKGVTCFYHRDRGEDNVSALHWNSLEEWINNASDIYDADYVYWWDGEDWNCKDLYSGDETLL